MVLKIKMIFEPFIVIIFVLRIIEIVYDGKLQDLIPSELRATIPSVKGVYLDIGAITIYLSLGAIADRYGYKIGFYVAGWIAVEIGLIYLIFVKQAPNKTKLRSQISL